MKRNSNRSGLLINEFVSIDGASHLCFDALRTPLTLTHFGQCYSTVQNVLKTRITEIIVCSSTYAFFWLISINAIFHVFSQQYKNLLRQTCLVVFVWFVWFVWFVFVYFVPRIVCVITFFFFVNNFVRLAKNSIFLHCFLICFVLVRYKRNVLIKQNEANYLN